MKFGYRDRIILLIVCVVVIFAVGIFVFIKPKWETLNNDQDRLKSVQSTWDTQRQNYNQITTRQNVIKEKYAASKDIADNFTNEMTAVEMDEFLRKEFLNTEKFKTDEVEVREAFSVADESTSVLAYYYYTPNIVTYPLYESADLDGSLAKAAQEKRKDADFLSLRSSQAVGSGHSTVTLRINREDTMALLDAVKDYAEKHSDAMLIKSVRLTDSDFNEKLEEENKKGNNVQANQGDAGTDQPDNQPAGNGNKDTVTNEKGIKKGFTDVTIDYEVYYIQEPTEPYVGDPYDANIWNGNEWRTKKAQ